MATWKRVGKTFPASPHPSLEQLGTRREPLRELLPFTGKESGKSTASLITPQQASPPYRGPCSSHQHCTQQAELRRAPLLRLLPGAGAADGDVGGRLTDTQEKEEGLGRVKKGR